VTSWALQDRATSDASIDTFERRFGTDGVGLWALELLSGGRFIGYTGLAPMPDGVPGSGGWEIGWRLAADAWHHGYASEAAGAVLDLAFAAPDGGLGLDAVWSMTAVLNQPSIAVMRRLGMSEYARVEHPRVPVGHVLRPHVVYRVTAAERGPRDASR
jgi:RimJ/RimL family protein N-acetyltransferase